MAKINKGDVISVTNNQQLVVIEVLPKKKVVVDFLGEHKCRTTVDYSNLTRGVAKNPYYPSVCGVGFFGIGRFVSSVNREKTLAYDTWTDMIKRCYSKRVQEKSPAYIGCTVCSEWHNFQNFAKWYTEHKNYGLGYQLDKDILVRGNKVYSPDTCSLIPRDLNVLLTSRSKGRGKYLLGVYKKSGGDKFTAQISIEGERLYLGDYDTEKEAHLAYIIAKDNHVKNVAKKWRRKIDERVYEALMDWHVIEG